MQIFNKEEIVCGLCISSNTEHSCRLSSTLTIALELACFLSALSVCERRVCQNIAFIHIRLTINCCNAHVFKNLNGLSYISENTWKNKNNKEGKEEKYISLASSTLKIWLGPFEDN